MSFFFSSISDSDYLKLNGKKFWLWDLLNNQPDGWLLSLSSKTIPLPKYTIVIHDCGAWHYKLEKYPRIGNDFVTPEWAMFKYWQRAKIGDFIVQPDHLLIPGKKENYRRQFNRESAHKFIRLDRPYGSITTGVAHGLTIQEKLTSALELYDIGYPCIGIGGLAHQPCNFDWNLQVVQTIRDALPKTCWLHVFGLSSPEYAREFRRIGVNSFDGASHFIESLKIGSFWFAESGKLKKYQAALPEETPTAPSCNCRVCYHLRNSGIETRKFGNNSANKGRVGHNLNQLIIAQKFSVSALIRPLQLSFF